MKNKTIVTGTIEIKGYLDIMKRVYDPHGISPTLHSMQGGSDSLNLWKKETERRYGESLQENAGG